MTAGILHLPDWLRQRAAVSPQDLALVSGGLRLTFSGLDRKAQSRAAALYERGIRPGQRLALLMGNTPEFVALIHAAPRLGAAVVPLNTRLAHDELSRQLEDAEPSLLIFDAQNEEKARSLTEKGGLAETLSIDQLRAGPSTENSPGPPEPSEPIDLYSVHSIIYTSGTTGRPKGVMLTLGNYLWNAFASALNLGLREDDRWLACLPLFHVGGLSILFRSVVYGIPVILHDGFDAAAVNRSIDGEGVTIISVVATMLQRLLEERGGHPYPPTLRCVLAGGGPVPHPLLEECARRGIPVVQTYGLTEAASQVATLAPADSLRKLGAAGKPLWPIELCIQTGSEMDCAPAPPGAAGEILVRGPTVTAGYFHQPEATALLLHDGWLHTGDVGYLDEEGYLYVLDRRDDLIITGGENVYPAEVEEVLRSNPCVADAAVFGLPDERWGQRVAAAVTLRPGFTPNERELVAFCTGRLAGYKTPREVRIVSELPRNAAGKLLRRLLRENTGR